MADIGAINNVTYTTFGDGIQQYKTNQPPEFKTFSGADIIATINVPVEIMDPRAKDNNSPIHRSALTPVVIANIQTITISTHRDKFPVRALKSINPRGFTRGPRTIAGTIIFTMFDHESLREVQDKVRKFFANAHNNYVVNTGNQSFTATLPRLLSDQLPPFDITISMANEYGWQAKTVLTGVEIVDWGNAMGVDDMFIEETMTYMARNIVPLHPDRVVSDPVPKVQ